MTKKDQIIEIFEKWQDYIIDPDVYNEITDAILALFGKQEGVTNFSQQRIIKDIDNSKVEQKERESPEEILKKYKLVDEDGIMPQSIFYKDLLLAMEEYAQSRQPEITDEEITKWVYKQDLGYGNSYYVYGRAMVEGAKAMRDHPEQFKSK